MKALRAHVRGKEMESGIVVANKIENMTLTDDEILAMVPCPLKDVYIEAGIEADNKKAWGQMRGRLDSLIGRGLIIQARKGKHFQLDHGEGEEPLTPIRVAGKKMDRRRWKAYIDGYNRREIDVVFVPSVAKVVAYKGSTGKTFRVETHGEGEA